MKIIAVILLLGSFAGAQTVKGECPQYDKLGNLGADCFVNTAHPAKEPAPKMKCAYDLKPQTIDATNYKWNNTGTNLIVGGQDGPYISWSTDRKAMAFPEPRKPYTVTPPTMTVCPFERAIEVFGSQRVKYEDEQITRKADMRFGGGCEVGEYLSYITTQKVYGCSRLIKRVLVDGEVLYEEK